MIKEEYKNGCRLKEQVKYNIDYDDCQILNLTCANYIYDLVQESSKYETKLEDVKKMLYMIKKLLGHEVQYDIPEYHGDNKKCYYDEQTGTIRRYDGNRWDTKLAGTSDKRPTENLIVGTCYFDITLNKPIYYNGSKWVDATGATV